MIQLPNYQIDKLIYESNNSLIYCGYRLDDQISFIFKQLKQENPSLETIARFKQEYEITKQLDIPPIINVYDLLQHQGHWIMVVEDFGGISLSQQMPANGYPIADFLLLAIQMASILAQIHQHNIIHKDINPTNIVYNTATYQLKLIDFGIASRLSRETPTFRHPNTLEGTLAYMSPEQTGRMNRALDYRTDFYALGVTFYQLLTGQLPFKETDPLSLVHCHLAQPPTPPHEIKPDIPAPLSQIILKLMAKDVENRYQSAQGLQADLEICWQQWQIHQQVKPFTLAQQDFTEHFQIPDKLYGRDTEIKQLLLAFDRVSQGTSEMMLVAGHAGIGKSALVREVYKPLTKQRGYAIAGKYDQLQKNIPYFALIQAFRDLIRQLLTEDETQIAYWKEQLLTALGSNGQLVIDVIPEVELIIGAQPPIPELGVAETKNRFTYVLQNFIRVFTQKEHPLALFLDDLQWADAASLNLIQQLITAPDIQHLFLVGAYRDNEVTDAHPLRLTLNNIQKEAKTVNELTLSPLTLIHINQIVAETLDCPLEQSEPLAELIREKTGGNPFFIGEFLRTLYTEELLTFDHTLRQWQWQLSQIQAQNITANIVELMSSKIKQLPANIQQLLSLAACIGNRFDLETLSAIYQQSTKETSQALWHAISIGLVLPLEQTYQWVELDIPELTDSFTVEYKFAHDRIQQAAYALISIDDLATFHQQVGQRLRQNTPPEKQEQHLFNIVNHLNIAASLLTDAQEREELAQLNLTAGKKAKASAAYMPAFEYLSIGRQLLSEDSWTTQYSLTLALFTEMAEVSYLIGNLAQMEQLAQTVLDHVPNPLDTTTIYKTLVLGYSDHDQMQKSIDIGLEGLRKLGEHQPSDPQLWQVVISLGKTQLALRNRDIATLADLPAMTDPYQLAILDLQIAMVMPVFATKPNLYVIVTCNGIQRFLKYGNAPASASFYGGYGVLLAGVTNDIDGAAQFGQLALQLMSSSHLEEYEASIMVVYGMIHHWYNHLRNTLPHFITAYQRGLETGDINMAATGAASYGLGLVFTGDNLEKFEPEIVAYSQMLDKFKQKTQLSYLQMYLQTAFNLTHVTDHPTKLIGQHFDEETMHPIYNKTNNQLGLFILHLYKLVLNYLFANYEEAIANADLAKKNIDGATSTTGVAAFYFYDSLARLAIYPQASKPTQGSILLRVAGNQRKIKKWAHHAAMNHQHKYHLIQAELGRVLGKTEKTATHYEKAIQLAQENQYINDKALACELAGKFYIAKEQTRIASFYLRDAHHAYQQWGAKAKTLALEKQHPKFFMLGVSPNAQAATLTTLATTTSTNAIAHLDVASILKASQALSGEIKLDSLLDKLMSIVIENAGAQIGYFLTQENNQWHIVAQGHLNQTETITTQMPATSQSLPLTLVHYVARTKQPVVLHEATIEDKFNQDPYIIENQPQSILCLPLINQGKINGVLYLENNLTTYAFTFDKIQTLNVLSTQAAISLENAHLYTNLEKLVAERTQELSETNQYLTASNAELDAFAHTVAHDLKNPLTGILGYAQLLNTQEQLIPESAKKFVIPIVRNSEKMNSIIDNLLLLANVRQGDVDITPIDLNEIIEDVKLRLAHMLQESQATITTQSEYPSPLGYAPWVEEILANYISNAIKYGGSPPQIHIGATPQTDNTVQIWVQDNGQGLTAEQCRKLFTPFTRVTQDTHIKGHGLGLSIVQRIAGKLNGTVGVKSEMGSGSRFYITLPTKTVA